jgi:stage III sporulation protein AB
VCLCTCFGYLLAGNYRNRKQFYKHLFDFNERFLNEIAYYKRPLGEFIAKYRYTGYFQEVLQAFQWQLSNQSLHTGVDFKQLQFLKREETEFLGDYFQMLGKGDSSSQKSYFTAMKDEIGKRYNAAEKEYNKYGDLYIKLGFLCGLFLLILIV